MHLEDPQASSELLRFVRDRIAITNDLPDDDLLDLIAGYPEVVHRWIIAPRIASRDTLQALADDAHQYRFSELKKLLPTLSGSERLLAMRLALLPSSDARLVWEKLEAVLMEDCRPVDRDALRRKGILESSTPPSYGHGKRYEAAQRYITADAPVELGSIGESLIIRLAQRVRTVSQEDVVYAIALVELQTIR